MNKGIDYSMGNGSNTDSKTGIRYGVISMHEITQAWCDSSEPMYACDGCDYEKGDDNCSGSDCEPLAYILKTDEYDAQDCLDSDVMVTRSPYYTFCQFCSPCVPGAGNLDSPMDDGIKTFCFGHDWFDDGKAPYKVFRVDDDSEVIAM